MRVSASVYSNSERELLSLVEELDAHGIDSIHLDCADKIEVFEDVKTIRKESETAIDLHIISKQPERYFEALKNSEITEVTWQLEDLPKDFEFPNLPGIKQGIAIVSTTDIEILKNWVDRIDYLLMMSTSPGVSGGLFRKENFDRIRQVRNLYPKLELHVDGGVNQEVSFILRNLGVHQVVSGSYLVNGKFVGASLNNLRSGGAESQYTVGDMLIGRDELPVAGEDANLHEVLELMENGKRGFVLLKNNEGKLAGIVSNADLRRGLLKKFDELAELQLSDIVNPNPVTAKDSDSITEMVRMVKALPFTVLFLPVISDDGELKGAVTFNNLIKGEL